MTSSRHLTQLSALFGHIQLAINKNKYSQRNHRFNARTAQVFAASYATIKISIERVLVFHRAADENIDKARGCRLYGKQIKIIIACSMQ